MFIEVKKEAHRFQIESKLVDRNKAKEVLDLLFDEDGDYVIYHYEDPYHVNSSILQRVNLLWVWPALLLICPFKWLFTGKFAVNSHSKFAKAVEKLIGKF